LLTVRDRFLMANGIREDAIRNAVKTLRAAQKDLLAICNSKYLSKEVSNEMIAYLQTFFQNIDGDDSVPVTMKVQID
jgi:hypothetical protein